MFSRYYCVLLFFFNLTRTLANVHFSRRTQGQRRRKMVCERDVCFSLSLVPLGVGLSRLDDQKKKITRVHLLCRHEQRFPRFTRAQSIGGHRESSSTGRTITTRNRICPFVSSFSVLLYIKLLLFDFFACVVIKFISSFSFFFFSRESKISWRGALTQRHADVFLWLLATFRLPSKKKQKSEFLH